MRWREFREKIRKTFKLIDILESGKRRISVSRRFLLLASVSVLVLVGIVLVGSGLAQTRSIIIWSQQQPENTTHNGSIAVSPNGQLVASGRTDSNDVNIWNAANGALIRTLNGRDNNANALAFSPDSQYLVSGSTSNLSLNQMIARHFDCRGGLVREQPRLGAL